MGEMTRHMRADAPARTMALFATSIVIAAALIVTRQANAGEVAGQRWAVGEIQGEARIRTGGAPWKALHPGQAISTNAEIETGPAGRVRLTGPGGSVTALPNSGLALRGFAGAAGDGVRIVQRRGNLQFAIAAGHDRPFRIETPFLTAAIRKAAFTLAVNARNAALYVSDGTARVRSVLTGEGAMVGQEYMAWVNAPSGGRLQTVAIHPRTAPPGRDLRKTPARAPRTERGKALAALGAGRVQG